MAAALSQRQASPPHFAVEARYQRRRHLVHRAPNIAIARHVDALWVSTGAPDCQSRDVNPKYAATSGEQRNRDGSSIAVTKLNTVTGPTPGWRATNFSIRPRIQGHCFHSIAHAASMASIGSLVSASPAAASRTAASKPVRPVRVLDRGLETQHLALQVAALRQQKPRPDSSSPS